ncbi:MAG: hypothetical protein GY861_08030 [bacterium]|nr:hypothetical protein [bacterium]
MKISRNVKIGIGVVLGCIVLAGGKFQVDKSLIQDKAYAIVDNTPECNALLASSVLVGDKVPLIIDSLMNKITSQPEWVAGAYWRKIVVESAMRTAYHDRCTLEGRM